MNPSSHAAARAPLHHAREGREPDADPASEESLAAHAKRSLRCALTEKARAVLDAAIAALQGLRKRLGGAGAHGEEDGEMPRGRSEHGRGRHDETAEEAGAAEAPPRPKRRLRAVLIYLFVMVAGGIGGGALAFNLLATQLDKQSAEARKTEAAMLKNTKAMAANQKKLDEAVAARDELTKKLEASQAEYAKSATETQKKLEEVEQKLAPFLAAEAASKALQQAPRTLGAAGKAHPPKTGDCSLVGGNVAALKDCVNKFNH